MTKVNHTVRPSSMLHTVVVLLCLQWAACVLGTRAPIEFLPNLSEHTAATGSTLELHCIVTSAPQGSEFTWSGPAVSVSRASTTLEDNSGTISKLTITNIQDGDAGTYTCSFTGLTAISTTVQVVSNTVPTFLTVSEHQQFAEGTDAIIRCPVIYSDTGAQVFMFWEKGGRQVTSNDRITAEIGQLTIQNIGFEDEGEYRCDLSDAAYQEYGRKTITVDVLPRSEFAPRINDSQRRIEVIYGEPLNLPCLLQEPKENVTYSWTINTEFERDHLIDTRANLYRYTDEFLSGIYTCKAENKFGYDVVDFIVKIVAPPLPEECSRVRKTTSLGTTVVLRNCELTSPAELSDMEFCWSKRNDAGEMVKVVLSERVSINHNGWLTIKDVQQSDLGVYQVNISNGIGSAVHTVQLELAQAQATTATQTASLPQAQVGAVQINLKLTVQGISGVDCGHIKEGNQDVIKQHLFEGFGYTDVVLEGVTITCLSDSEKKGILRANLRGRDAGQLAAVIKERGATTVKFDNGLSLSLEVCTDDCSSTEPVPTEATGKPISNTAGVIVAVSFICVVLAGVILLVVILVRYRRRSMVKDFDTEQAQPLHFTMATRANYRTGFDSLPKKKPIYGRSISVNFPMSR